jgi:hypothetical protein
MPGMNEHFQFSTRNLLVATALLALCCALFASHGRVTAWATEVALVDRDGDGNLDVVEPAAFYDFLLACYSAAMMAMPSISVCVLAGRPWLGTLCGAATGALVMAFFAAAHFGLWP